MFARRALPVILAAMSLVFLPARAHAQRDCVSGCIPPYQVEVDPDGTNTPSYPAYTSGYNVVFTIWNTGENSDTFDLNCYGTGGIVCTGQQRTSVFLRGNQQITDTVYFSVGGTGTGTIKLNAVGVIGDVDHDLGYFNVPVVVAAGAPIIDTTPYNSSLQDYGRCAQACFAATYSQSTVPYFSLGAARAATLVYNGDRVSPHPFVLVNVKPDPNYGSTPTQYQLSVRVNGALVTFVNGEQTLHFAYSDTAAHRIGGQFDASTYTTGVYPLEIDVAAQYASSVITNVAYSKLVVVNENTSAIGRGWSVAGVSRAYVQSDSSVLIVGGDGSAVYFRHPGNGGWNAPAGDFSSLSRVSGVSWTRAYPDSTKIVFNASGLMTQVVDRFGNATTVTYDGSNRISKIKDPLNIPLTLGYGTYGLATVQDTGARVTQFTVDASGRLTAITDPDNIGTAFGYDASLRLSTITNRRGFTTTLGYDTQSGLLATVTAPSIKLYNDSVVSPVTTLAAWQKLGVPYSATNGTPATAPRADTVKATVTEPGGAVTRFTVNRWGTPVQVTDPLGRLTTTVFDGNGLARRITYPSGAVDSAVYNSSGLPTFVQTADATNRRNILYANWAQPDSAWGGPQPAMRAFIGTNGRVDSVRVGGSSVTHFTYDNMGRVVTSTDPEGHLLGKHWFTAIFGNASQDSLPGGFVTTYGYDAFGRDTSVKGPLTPARRVHFDVVNRASQYLDGVYVTPTTMAYDSSGNVTAVTDAKGQVYRFAYNALGWLTARTDPTGHADSLKYNRDGDLMRRVNRRGQTVSLAYDALHRATSKLGTNTDTLQWTYSTDGSIVTAASPVSVETAYLNPRGQDDSVKTVLGGQTFWRRYHYTAIGLADSVAPSGGGISFRSRKYTFDPALLTVTGIRLGSTSAGTTSLSYNHDLVPASTTFRGAEQEARQYDAVNQIASISNTSSYADTVTRMLAYDKQGRLTQQVDGGGQYGAQYSYDGLGRLVADSGMFAPNPPADCQGNPPPIIGDQGSSCIGSEAWTISAGANFAYDSVGNRADHSGAYSTGNRITAFGGCTYGTDTDGNVTSRSCSGQSVAFKWTAEGLMDTVVVGSLTFGYRYDAAGRLVRKDSSGTVIRYFLWDGANLLAELNGAANGEVAEYSYYGTDHLHAVIVGGVEYDAHRDALGSIVALTDSAQQVKRSYIYDDWGGVQNGGDYLPFNGADRVRWKSALLVGNEAGLYYMRARWYEPQSGRFLSEDPIGLKGGINEYAFGSNDPVNNWDPTGEDCILVQTLPPTQVCNPWGCQDYPGTYEVICGGGGGSGGGGGGSGGGNGGNGGGGGGGGACTFNDAGMGGGFTGCPTWPQDVGNEAVARCVEAGLWTTGNAVVDLSGLREAISVARLGVGALGRVGRFAIAQFALGMADMGRNATMTVAQDAQLGQVQGVETETASMVLGLSAGFVPGGGTALSGLQQYKVCWDPQVSR